MRTADPPHLRVVYLPVFEVRRIQRLISRRYRSIRSTRKARANALELINWLQALCGRKREIETVEMKAVGTMWQKLAGILAECGAADLTLEILKQLADVD